LATTAHDRANALTRGRRRTTQTKATVNLRQRRFAGCPPWSQISALLIEDGLLKLIVLVGYVLRRVGLPRRASRRNRSTAENGSATNKSGCYRH
jgi:hypothetical protein